MNRRNVITPLLLIVSVFFALKGTGLAQDGQFPVSEGDKIAFMGDSITAGGTKQNGYITLVMNVLNKEGLSLTSIPAGKSGHKSNDMLTRLDSDVISKKPQWMILSCGVNDVWHFKLRLGERTFQGVSLEDYQKNIRAIIEKAQAADIKVMILTPLERLICSANPSISAMSRIS